MREPDEERARGARRQGAGGSSSRGGRRARASEAASQGAAARESELAEALTRAREHIRAALAELLQALCALADAASLAATGAPASAHPPLVRLVRSLERLGAALAGEGRAPDGLIDAIAHALDGEIERWEARAHDDPEARALLRAYLGLRELLWELGVRRTPGARAARTGRRARPPAADGTTAAHTAGARRRLQRVPLA